jgi:photosystem II stability/assembly factor-like uncharacterized protein
MMHGMHVRGSSLILASILAATALAVLQADSPFGDLRWRFIGPFRGGRVLAVAGVPGEPHHFYFGSVNGGVWETRDAGRTWVPLFDGQPVGSIGAIAVAPSDPRVIYVGTGEADMRSDVAQGDGMFKSIDAGKTWRQIGLADSQQIAHIEVHPTDPSLVYVAALGHPYGPNAERGVFRSRDGGEHWEKILGLDDDTGAVDVVLEPGNPRVMYAALWQTRRPPWSAYPSSSGPGSGVYTSQDGGDSWTKLAGGLPVAHGRVGLAIAPSRPSRVYAIVDAEVGGGLYRSDDRGASWSLASGDHRIWQRGWYFGRVTVDPSNADRVFALNTIVLRSEDGGRTFVPLKGDPTGDDFHELWIDPKNPERQILGTDQGTLITLNGGHTWSSWHNQPTAQFYHVVTDNRFPYFVYGSQQDSGAAGVPSRTTTRNGINLTNFREIEPGGESDNIAPDPEDPDVIYGGRVDRLDLRTGQTRNIDPTLAFPGQHRVEWTLPLVFSKRDPRVLYFGRQQVYRTDDQGEHWKPISPDLTREDPGIPSNLDAPTASLDEGHGARRGVVYAIAPSPLVDHLIWAGTDDGLIWRTDDEGAHWDNVTPTALGSWSKVGIIDASHHDRASAYAAVDRHRLDDFRPYIYRTHDAGKTWTLAVNGIPSRDAVNVVREDPVRKGLLYAGTERGVYVSFDDGDSWQSLKLNLPATSVRDIEVKGVDVVIATHGRGFWILDDVSALRQMDVTRAPETRLFAPAPAIRLRPAGFTGTPFPKDEPAAPNPPDGAAIDYVLATPPASPVVLVIRDASGTEVRRYSSQDAPPAVNMARLPYAPEWVPAPVTLSATPGLHRFVWPLRYAAAQGLGHGPFDDGVWAPPGRYTVELVVDGRTFTQPLEVQPDPRVSLPAAAYGEEFTFARRAEAARGRVVAAYDAASALQVSVSRRRLAAKGDERSSLQDFESVLSAVSGVPVSTNPEDAWWRPAKALTTLRYLAETLRTLSQAIDGADGGPSPDARDGLAKVEALIPPVLEEWDRVKGPVRQALDERLRKAGAPPIE